jgi:hypothetical protein
MRLAAHTVALLGAYSTGRPHGDASGSRPSRLRHPRPRLRRHGRTADRPRACRGVGHSPRIPRHQPHGLGAPSRSPGPVRRDGGTARRIAGSLRRIFCALRSGIGYLRRGGGPLLLGVVASDSGVAGAGRKAAGPGAGVGGADFSRSGPRASRDVAEPDAVARESRLEEARAKPDPSRSGADAPRSFRGELRLLGSRLTVVCGVWVRE